MKKRICCALLALLLTAALLPFAASAAEVISDIVIKNLVGPIAGDVPHKDVEANNNSYTADVVAWFRWTGSGYEQMEDTDPFAEGQKCMVLLRIDPTGKAFLQSDPAKLTLTMINCVSPTDYQVSFTPKDGDDNQTRLMVTIVFDAPLTYQGEKISEIALNALELPAEGKQPNLSVVNPKEDAYYLGGAMGWLEDGHSSFMSDTDVFRAGRTYYVGFNAAIKAGYYFDPYNVRVKVNGALLTDGVNFSATGTNADSRMFFIRYVCPGWAKNADGTWSYYDHHGKLTGWQKYGGRWYYLGTDGVMRTGWQKIDGKWYYLDATGAMATGWKQVAGKWYYLDASGAMRTGWLQADGKRYYLGTDGAMATGWKKIGENWYYLKNDVKTGWQQIGGKWYYLGADGAMRIGWKQISGKWYYLGADGAMATGWKQISGRWYYLGTDGAMRTGWQKVDGKWYYLDTTGAMRVGWLKDGGKWYYFKVSGAMAVSESLSISGKTYIFDFSGACTNP